MDEYAEQRASGLSEGMADTAVADVAPREVVIVPISGSTPGVVGVVWLDQNETPLEQINRLKSELADAESMADLVSALKEATSEVQDAIYSLQSVESAVSDVEMALSRAQDALENVELP